MVDLEIIIVLPSMPYNVDLNACDLHMGDEKTYNNLIDEW